MKISELIKILQKVKKDIGDVVVVTENEAGYWRWHDDVEIEVKYMEENSSIWSWGKYRAPWPDCPLHESEPNSVCIVRRLTKKREE